MASEFFPFQKICEPKMSLEQALRYGAGDLGDLHRGFYDRSQAIMVRFLYFILSTDDDNAKLSFFQNDNDQYAMNLNLLLAGVADEGRHPVPHHHQTPHFNQSPAGFNPNPGFSQNLGFSQQQQGVYLGQGSPFHQLPPNTEQRGCNKEGSG